MTTDFKLTLLVDSGPLKGRKFSIEEPILCVIGREYDCNLRIESSSISRHHCIIEAKPPHAYIKDLGSTNGTFINERVISVTDDMRKLYNGDMIRLGDDCIFVQLSSIGRDDNSGVMLPSRITEGYNVAKQVPIHGYHVKKELGRGGAGVVYLAEHEESHCEVAVKIMLPNIKISENERDMFFREINLTKDIDHKNIVKVTDHGYSNDIFFFVQEFCDRGSIVSLVKDYSGRVPVELATDLTLQMLDGLEYAHNFFVQGIKLKDGTERGSKGIVHRDIKPENVLLKNIDGHLIVKIADFGLSKAFNQAGFTMGTMTGAFCGTPGFVSRQQLLNYKYAKPEVDVWGVVATYYYMLTGVAPRGDDFGENPLRMILEKEPIPIRSIAPKVSKKLAILIDSALDDTKELRYKRAIDFKRELIKSLA